MYRQRAYSIGISSMKALGATAWAVTVFATGAGAAALRPTALIEPVLPAEQITRVEAPLSPMEEIQEADALRELAGLPPRFAERNPVSITPDTDGVWETLKDGRPLWRLRVGSPGAASLNLGFVRYHMPEDGQLFVYTSDEAEVVRPFTAADNKPHGQLWTPILHHDEITVEITLPNEAAKALMEIEIGAINPGYRPFGGLGDDPITQSGSCNIDVVCPEGDGWRDQIQSVGVYTLNGFWTCTGAAINNTAFDRTPYFLTADHCGVSASNDATMVVYWNYENSTCRPPGSGASGGSGDGQLNQFQTGATLRAEYNPSDMTLVELDQAPDPAWEVFYSGWNRASGDFSSVVAIHHPGTDEKRISFENDPTTTTSYLQNTVPGAGTHIRVIDWDEGTTEGGSSGSPLYDPNQRIVGQLHGGFASCSSQTSDWYGRVSVSWDGGGTPSSRLKDWLDPLNTGAIAIDGTGLAEAPVSEDISTQVTINTPSLIALSGSDANMDPLDYIVMTLPLEGTLSDPQAGAINSVPYTLANQGRFVLYTPALDYTGGDIFTYRVNDGTPPPDGGNSNIANVSINVVNVPPTIQTAVLPDGAVGDPYGPLQLQVQGGEGGVVWQIVADVPYVESDLGTSGFAEVGVAQGYQDDDKFWSHPLPFPFPFYDNVYSEVRIWSNGFLNFGPHTGSGYNNSEAALIANRRIAPLWDDLKTTGPGEDIFVDTTGIGTVTIRWKASTYAGNHPVNIAVTLHDDGAIDLHYGPGNAPVTPTVGVSDGDGTRYTISQYNNAGGLSGVNSVRLKKPDQLSAGLHLSGGGVLSGTPQEAGEYLPIIRVTDGLNRSDEAAIPLMIRSFPGDFDLDGDIDGDDVIVFTACLAGPMTAPPAGGAPPSEADCLAVFDFNADTRVDLVDFASLQGAMVP
jgi:hypothetical protein